MVQTYFIELIPDKEQGGFTARIPDVPAYGEGETPEEAIADLKEALRGYAEAFGVEDLQKRMHFVSDVRREELDLQELTHG
jgi:predicted RNase H-like HicB family nuclease